MAAPVVMGVARVEAEAVEQDTAAVARRGAQGSSKREPRGCRDGEEAVWQ